MVAGAVGDTTVPPTLLGSTSGISVSVGPALPLAPGQDRHTKGHLSTAQPHTITSSHARGPTTPAPAQGGQCGAKPGAERRTRPRAVWQGYTAICPRRRQHQHCPPGPGPTREGCSHLVTLPPAFCCLLTSAFCCLHLSHWGREGLNPILTGAATAPHRGKAKAWLSTTKVQSSCPGKHIPLDKASPQCGLPRSLWGHRSRQIGLADVFPP